MKCLLCSSKFKDQKELLDHYLSYHNIDKNNWFFQKLFQSNNKTLLKNCIRCNEFLATEKQKAVQDFMKHLKKERIFDLKRSLLILKDTLELQYITLNIKNAAVFIIFTILKNVSMTF